MQRLQIKGGRKISGTIVISGSKNATLPILASTILSDKKITITNVPLVRDVETMIDLLTAIGSTTKLNRKKKKIEILNKKPLKTFATYYLLKTMRAGVLVLGPLLEANIRRSLIVSAGDWSVFFERPISLILILISVLALALPIFSRSKNQQ